MAPVTERNLAQMIARQAAKSSRFWIASPWITLQALKGWAVQGRDVKILVKPPGMDEYEITDWNLMRDLSELPNVEIRALPKLHAKIYLFDAAVITGSSNLTPSGFGNNSEFNIFSTDMEDVSGAEKKFMEDWMAGVVLFARPVSAWTSFVQFLGALWRMARSLFNISLTPFRWLWSLLKRKKR